MQEASSQGTASLRRSAGFAVGKEGIMPSFTASPTAHIFLDEQGRAWIDETNVKVVEVVLDRIAGGLTAERMVEEHYGRLSLAQIYAALSYYYDHQAELDAEIEGQVRQADALRAANLESPMRQRFRALGKLP
jgi:uncharacterized protein (DUF433 family)